MGLSIYIYIAKNRKNFEFLVKVSQKGQIPLNNFKKIKAGMVSQVRTLTPNFTIVTLKMWAYSLPNRRNL